MIASVEIEGHGIKQFAFPLTADEMTFGEFVDFKKALEAGGLVGRPADDEGPQGSEGEESEASELVDPVDMDPSEYFSTIVQALSQVIRGPIHLLDLYSADDNVSEIMTRGCRFQIGEPFNVIRIYGHLLSLLNGYRTDRLDLSGDFAVDYKGKRYVINQDRAKRFFTRQSFTVVEVIEIQETRRLFNSAIAKKGDPDGALEFEMDLRTVAVLLREPGHLLPINKAERHRYLETMARHFSDLPMDAVLDIRFFLRSTLRELVKTLTMQSYLTGSVIWSLIHHRKRSGGIRKIRKQGSRRLGKLTDLSALSGWFSLPWSTAGSKRKE